MIYTRKLHVGRCGLFRRNQGQRVIVSFDPSRPSYRGVWLCFGGWPASGLEPKQVADRPRANHGTMQYPVGLRAGWFGSQSRS
jgi:hypothetical protein